MSPVFRLLSLLICSTAVCVSTVNGQGQCPNGFIEQSSLPGLVNAAVTRPEGYLYLFFSVNFTCQVEVSGFILLATEIDVTGEYPFIQIWREASTNFYNRAYNIGSSDEVTFLGNSLYRYTPTSGNITLLPGDILGLLALSSSNSRITPYLLNQSSPQYYEISVGSIQLGLTEVFANNQLNFRNQYSPLVAIEPMNQFSSSSISSSVQTTTTLTSVPTSSIITSTVYPSSYISLPSTDYSTLIVTSSSRMYYTTSTPSLSSPTLSPVLAGVIGGAIVAVVGVIVCLLMIAVYCVKKKVRHSEADGGAALGLQTSSTMKIEQKSNPAYSTVTITNDPTYDSATEMQTNVAYASTNFDTAMVDATYTEVDTYDII